MAQGRSTKIISMIEWIRTNPQIQTSETANGSFPDTAVQIMAKIVEQAETGINYYQV